MKPTESVIIVFGLAASGKSTLASRLARHLGLALTQRKLAQTVVLVGGVIGAGVNRQLAGEVGEVAFHAYRRRQLIDRALLRKEGVLPWAATPTSAKKSFLPKPPSYD